MVTGGYWWAVVFMLPYSYSSDQGLNDKRAFLPPIFPGGIWGGLEVPKKVILGLKSPKFGYFQPQGGKDSGTPTGPIPTLSLLQEGRRRTPIPLGSLWVLG